MWWQRPLLKHGVIYPWLILVKTYGLPGFFFFCQGFFESFLEFKESLCWKFPALRTNSVPSFYVLRVFT